MGRAAPDAILGEEQRHFFAAISFSFRFRESTFTLGSPRNPNCLGMICSETNCPNRFLAEVTLTSDARNLVERRSRRDIRI